MTDIKNLTVEQLQRVISIKEQIAKLEAQLENLTGNGSSTPSATYAVTAVAKGPRKMSTAAKARIAAAQKARWAKLRGEKGAATAEPKKRRKMSAAGRAKIAAAARARWVKAKAEGKKTL